MAASAASHSSRAPLRLARRLATDASIAGFEPPRVWPWLTSHAPKNARRATVVATLVAAREQPGARSSCSRSYSGFAALLISERASYCWSSPRLLRAALTTRTASSLHC
jgi:hypothetical protein